MENINQLRKQETPLLFDLGIKGSNDIFAIDTENHRWFVPTTEGKIISHTLPNSDMDDNNNKETRDDNDYALCLPPIESRICHLEYVPMNAQLYICYESGEIVSYDIYSDNTPNSSEVLGIVTGGIRTASWAPDGTLGVIVPLSSATTPDAATAAAAPTAYLFSCEANTLTPLKHSAADSKKQPTVIHPDIQHAHWRGDSEYFLLSGPRGIDVYDRSGALSSSCIMPKDTPICADGIATWRPSGDLIAAIGQRADGDNSSDKAPVELLLFERAGYLRHRAPLCPPSTSKCVPIATSWNSSSDILAISLWSDGIDGLKGGRLLSVELWIVSNYEWELKSVIHIQSSQSQSQVAIVGFDPEDALTVRAALGRTLVTTRLGKSCTVGGALAYAAVVDGHKVRTTCLSKAALPPPLCAGAAEFAHNVLSTGFYCGGRPGETYMFVVFASNEVCVYHVTDEGIVQVDKKVDGAASKSLILSAPLLQPQMLSPTIVVGITSPKSLCVLDFAAGTCTDISTSIPVLAFGVGPQHRPYCQLADYKIYAVDIASHTVAQSPVGEIPGPVSILRPAQRPRSQTSSQEETEKDKKKDKKMCDDDDSNDLLLFGLTSTNKLYMGTLCVSDMCSSFLVHPNFLVYTTLDNKVRFIALDIPVTKETIARLEAEWPFALREIERGSVAVGFVKGSGLILQVPRGNLELIHPRALVLHSLRKLLERKLYGLAFREARRHRIDLNVLCDFNIDTFVADAEAFVLQVVRVDFINIFLSALRNEDICSSTYRTPAAILASPSDDNNNSGNCKAVVVAGKVNRICAAMRDVFRKVDSDKYLLATLTSFAVMTPPDIEGALAEVAKLDREKLEEALDYLAFLCDISALYDVALGTYDIPLVRIVAKKTQKDPREYLPFFDRLESLPLESRCYEIDMLLHRYSRAITHLLKSDEKDKKERCLNLMEKYDLYKDALQIFKEDKELYLTAVEKYAKHLSIYNRHEQSATLYETCNKYEDAATEYAECLQWEQAVSAIETAVIRKQVDEARKTEFISDLAEKLYLNELYRESAQIFAQVLGNPDRALDILIEGRLWREAWAAATRSNSSVEKQNTVVSSILKYIDQYISDISEAQESIIKSVAELESICAREAMLQSMGVGTSFNSSGCSSAWDSPSDTCSVMSASSTTSISRRRNNKKAKFDKKTTVLQRLLDALPPTSLQDELGAMLRVMFMGGHQDETMALQKAFKELIGKTQEALVVLRREIQKPNMLSSADKNRAMQWSERDWSLDFF